MEFRYLSDVLHQLGIFLQRSLPLSPHRHCVMTFSKALQYNCKCLHDEKKTGSIRTVIIQKIEEFFALLKPENSPLVFLQFVWIKKTWVLSEQRTMGVTAQLPFTVTQLNRSSMCYNEFYALQIVYVSPVQRKRVNRHQNFMVVRNKNAHYCNIMTVFAMDNIIKKTKQNKNQENIIYKLYKMLRKTLSNACLVIVVNVSFADAATLK